MNHSMPGFSQAHVHWVNDAIQPSQHLLAPSPPALNLFQHQALFQWVGSLHQVAKILELQHQSFQWNNQGWFPLWLTGLISLLSKRLSRVFSSTIAGKHQFFSAQPSLWSNSHICTWLPEKPWLWLYKPLSAMWCLCFLIYCRSFSKLFFQGESVF